MNDQLDAARRELREALAVARASLAQVRNKPVPVMGREVDSHGELDAPDGDV